MICLAKRLSGLVHRNSFSFCSPFLSASQAGSLHGQPMTKFIDCRDPNEYASQHIQGAVHVNEIFAYLARSDDQGVQVMQTVFEDAFQRAGINSTDNLITYENTLNTRFGSSSRGYFLLKTLGHKKVHVLDGGLDAWKHQGLPVDGEPVQPQKGNFKVEWDGSLWAGQQDVEQAIHQGNAKLLDVRDDEEWNGLTSSPYGPDFVPRRGRLPGAVHMNWKELFTTDDKGLVVMKEKEQIKTICQSKGLEPEDKIIVYCFKGARASNSLIALKHAGYHQVSNYFGSWNEWSRDFSLGIEQDNDKQ